MKLSKNFQEDDKRDWSATSHPPPLPFQKLLLTVTGVSESHFIKTKTKDLTIMPPRMASPPQSPGKDYKICQIDSNKEIKNYEALRSDEILVEVYRASKENKNNSKRQRSSVAYGKNDKATMYYFIPQRHFRWKEWSYKLLRGLIG